MLEFWDSFEESVHNNKKLFVTGFTLTPANYEAAIKMLQERFGRPEEISRVHYDGMIQLKPVVDDTKNKEAL